MLNDRGHLTEGTTMNVFFVEGGVVRTPALSSGILEGITRGLVVELVAREGLPFEEGFYPADALRKADEAFVTSTTRDVMPVGSVDGEPLRSPGPITTRIVPGNFRVPRRGQ